MVLMVRTKKGILSEKEIDNLWMRYASQPSILIIQTQSLCEQKIKAAIQKLKQHYEDKREIAYPANNFIYYIENMEKKLGL